MPRDTTPIGVYIDRLRLGWKWCSGCGLPRVHPAKAEGVILCDECTEARKPLLHCKDCGTKLPLGRIQFYKDKGLPPCRQCLYCHRGQTMPHIVHGVKCPAHWRDTSLPPDQKLMGHLTEFRCKDCRERLTADRVNDAERQGYKPELCDMCAYYRQKKMPNPKLSPSAA